MKNIVNKLLFGVILIVGLGALSCSDDIETPVEKIELDRLLAPINFKARITNNINANLSWEKLSRTDGFVVEIWEGDMVFETLVDKQILTESEYVKTLEGSTTYTARVKGTSDKGVAESKWNSVVFKTLLGESITVTASAIKSTEATITWEAGKDVDKIVLLKDEVEMESVTVLTTDVTHTFTGLDMEQNYLVEVYEGSKLKGYVTFTTLPDMSAGVPVADAAELIVAIANAANGDIISLTYNAAGYPIGTTTVTKSITIINNPDNTQVPVVSGNFLLNGVNNFMLQNLEFKGVAIDGIGENYSSLIEFDVTGPSDANGIITIDGCTIHDYKNAILYDKSQVYLYNSLNINNVLVYDIPGSGGDGIDIRKSFFANINITNSTFNNSFRAFLRYDPVTSGTGANISIANNTFNNVCGATGTKGLLYVRTSAVTVNFKSNIVANIPDTNLAFVLVVKEVVTNGGSIAFSKNYYYECNAPKMWANTTEAEATADGGIVATDPFQSSATGDFTLTDVILKADNIGDPRWIK